MTGLEHPRSVEVPDPIKHWTKMFGLMLLMSPAVVVGIVLCLSIVLIPLGVILIVLSAWPIYRCDQKYEVKLRAWQNSRRLVSPTSEVFPPWSLN